MTNTFGLFAGLVNLQNARRLLDERVTKVEFTGRLVALNEIWSLVQISGSRNLRVTPKSLQKWDAISEKDNLASEYPVSYIERSTIIYLTEC